MHSKIKVNINFTSVLSLQTISNFFMDFRNHMRKRQLKTKQFVTRNQFRSALRLQYRLRARVQEKQLLLKQGKESWTEDWGYASFKEAGDPASVNY